MGGSYSCLSSKPKCGIPHFLQTCILSSNNCDTVMEPLEGQNSTHTIEEQIEHSKTHWSQVSEFEMDAGEVVEVSNVEVFRTLQSHPNWGNFFWTFGKDGVGELLLGPKFAEGGQAELYDAKIQWNEPWRNEEDLRRGKKWALKVFKKGTSLRQLQLQWPRGILQNYVDKIEWERRGNLPKDRNHSDVYRGILLEDGRFAFLMAKEQEDLRCQIDHLMLSTRKNHCPFSKLEYVEGLMYKVAVGMEWLHNRGIIHRDLKASNVLCTRLEDGWGCYVADFECSIGVVGTGFFRAPEILQACKDYSIKDKPELFTKESDVYSYGMLCYEILTGKLPFEDCKLTDFDHVLVGERPKVPKYVVRWMRELLRMCWQSNPIDRPSFTEILEFFLANSKACREIHAYRKKREAIIR